MLNRFKIFLLTVGFLTSLSFNLLPAAVSAQVDGLRCGANSAATGDDSGHGCAKAPENAPSLNETIAKAINVISSLVAVASVIMIIVGGFRYVTSGGDSTKTGSARNTIMNAIIGLVIAVFAQVIVRFVLHSVK
jgi:magnesium-transporting ATPase (P-type)